jgi:hypothetical protein
MKRTYTVTKTVSGKPKKFRLWKDYSVGDILICKYVGTTENKYNEVKPNFVVEILETFLKNKLVEKDLVEGTHLVLNTTGMLDKAMSNVAPGTLLQITYKGTNAIEKGKFAGKEAHSIEVLEIEKDEEGSSHDDLDL